MFELPLFPLNTVLFPGQPLSLHIFEERYKEMIGLCIETQQPFGVVLLESGNEVESSLGTSPQPHSIGCTAQITQVRPLREGRMHITVVGRERFQIQNMVNDHRAYMVGMVEIHPMLSGNQDVMLSGGRVLRGLVERYLRVLTSAGNQQFDTRHLPRDSVALAYLGSVLLQGIPSEQKQQLLAADSTAELITELRGIYRREVILLETMLTAPELEQTGPFSLN
jgi:Lon protease-like protein